jgi:hypothetical protein
METAYQEIIRSFVDKYGLSRGQVIAEIEKTFSSMLSQWHHRDVVALFSDDQLQAVGYHARSGLMEQVPITLTTMRGWNSIRRILDTNLGKAACLQEVARYKRKERQLRWGEIIKRKNDGSLYVELEMEIGKNNQLIAVCPGNHIGVHERHKLLPGQRRAFHLRRVEPVLLKNTARVNVVVDRVSKTLVERLLQSRLDNPGITLRCLTRYVGHKSFVESTAFLPKKIILAASRELHEHIQVKIVKRSQGGKS